MIKAEKLTRTYGKVVAVKDVSFHIKSGEIVGLLGHNGAGKTTIMKMLTGFLQPSSGSIVIDGIDVIEHSNLIQASIGYLPENSPTYPDLTVISYLEYAAQLKQVPEQDIAASINAAINLTGIRDKAFSRISTLSRGYQQRVGVAQAILARPKILILDEPTNGLDPTQIEQMRGLIKDIAKTSTVIISTHILQEVQAICDRVLIIKNGHLVLDSALDKLQVSQRVVVATACPEEEFNKILVKVNGVREIEQLAAEAVNCKNIFAITVDIANTPTELDLVCANITAALVAAKQQVFAISPEKRDLETIFRDINMPSEVVENAA